MRDHGTRAKYVVEKCRCEPCTEANRRYARDRDRADQQLLPAYVDAAPVVAHLHALAVNGVGYKTAAARAGVAKTSLYRLLQGHRTRCTAGTAAAVLALPVDGTDLADRALVDARQTHKEVALILRKPGWTKARLSAAIGQGGRALQLGDRQVTARTARRIHAVAVDLGVVEVDPRRFPLEPLLRLHGTQSALARALGVEATQVRRWDRAGIPARLCDALAVKAGAHPAELWPDWYAEPDAEQAS